MEEITLNLIPGGATQVVHASQFDNGREFRLITYDGDTPFNPESYTAQFEAIKPDGNIVQAEIIYKDASSVRVTTTEQMCAVEGDTICEIKFSKNSKVIGTANFILRVEMDPIFEGTSSQSEGQIYDDIQNLKADKQNKLIAGSNIQLQDNGGQHPTTTISATDTTYSAGSHIAISAQNEISATYTAGDGIEINGDEISDVPYTAGAGISISTARVISADIATLPIATTASLGCIKVGANLGIDPDGTLSATGGGGGGGDYLAGDNIQISAARVISATDTTYTAGTGIDITGVSNEISVDLSDLADASTATAGLMSTADKTKLDGIEANANNYTLPVASTAILGGIKLSNKFELNSSNQLVPKYTSLYTAGTGIAISTAGVISVTYGDGDNILY